MKKFWSTLIVAAVVSVPLALAQEDQGGGKGVEVKPKTGSQIQHSNHAKMSWNRAILPVP